MKKLFIICTFLICTNIAFANSSTTCRNVGGSIYCDTYNYGSIYGTPANYGNWGNSFLSGFNSGIQARKNAIEMQNALIQQQMLLNQSQQVAQPQKQISSCKIDKIVGKEFPVGQVELILTWVSSDKYQIADTDEYVLTKDCFRYMKKQIVIADIKHSEDDRIYFY